MDSRLATIPSRRRTCRWVRSYFQQSELCSLPLTAAPPLPEWLSQDGERISIPENVAGSTLLISVKDDLEERELAFFINDDGEGVPIGTETRELVGV